MPSTVPENDSVAMNDSTPGTRMEKTSVDPSRVPMVNSENEAPSVVSHNASAAAIFIGWTSVMTLASRSPVMITARDPMSMPTKPNRTAGRKTSTSRFFIRKYDEMPANMAAPDSTAPAVTCEYAHMFSGWNSTAPMSFISARLRSGFTVMPTGCCMNEFADMMKNADSIVPMDTSQIAAQCRRGESLSHPKIHSPRNVDSRKNASSASMASGAPKTSPTNRE